MSDDFDGSIAAPFDENSPEYQETLATCTEEIRKFIVYIFDEYGLQIYSNDIIEAIRFVADIYDVSEEEE